MVRVLPPCAAVGTGLTLKNAGPANGHNRYRRFFVRHCRWFFLAIAFLFIAADAGVRTATADDWQPISPEELKMTSVPEAPGAAAVILYRQVDRDDSSRDSHQYNYLRIKILTEEGRKYGDVEIPFFKEEG